MILKGNSVRFYSASAGTRTHLARAAICVYDRRETPVLGRGTYLSFLVRCHHATGRKCPLLHRSSLAVRRGGNLQWSLDLTDAPFHARGRSAGHLPTRNLNNLLEK